ncbi:hypothetical protein SAMN04487969_10299 [Paenibacillus algorifonticola]|uniref:Uncharacterized protein n=1 Tax=Paenibacillus algorifonticola TaxID=684063 RepID=A0A1I1ZXT4_9BACL|nr:hypothetical protein SAMN04487969_10299 [Paenibacillus algorifonticola]
MIVAFLVGGSSPFGPLKVQNPAYGKLSATNLNEQFIICDYRDDSGRSFGS